MKYNISKELFKVVVGHSCTFIDGYEDDFIIVLDEKSGEDLYDLCIDSFFFMCKEWALEQGYNLVSCINKCHIQRKEVSMDMHIQTVMADSEQQAVFDATSWVLENKDK